MIRKTFSFIIIAGMITLVFLVIYAAVQQDMRQSANDPVIAMAEDTASYLNSGGDVTTLALQYDQVDIGQSLTPFLIVYDDQGQPVLSTGTLNGDVPTLPSGVLSYVSAQGEDRITWQPSSTAREAIVVVPYTDEGVKGFVLAGRSLREVEKRELSLEEIVFVGWALSLCALALLYILPLLAAHALSHEHLAKES